MKKLKLFSIIAGLALGAVLSIAGISKAYSIFVPYQLGTSTPATGTVLVSQGTNSLAKWVATSTLGLLGSSTAATLYVPYTGATGDVDLGAHNLTASTISVIGGTTNQFLKANGDVDSSTYLTQDPYWQLNGTTLSPLNPSDSIKALTYLDYYLLGYYKATSGLDLSGNQRDTTSSLTPWISSYATATNFSTSFYSRNTDTTGTGSSNVLNIQADANNRFIVGGDLALKTAGSILAGYPYVILYQGGAITYKWRTTGTIGSGNPVGFNDNIQHTFTIAVGTNGIKSYVDGSYDAGLFETTFAGSVKGFLSALWLGGSTTGTQLYWEVTRESLAARTINIYTYNGSSFIPVASGSGVRGNTGSSCNIHPVYTFTVTSANATYLDTYSDGVTTYKVVKTIFGATTLYASGIRAPKTDGVLTRISGTGDATITYSAASVSPISGQAMFTNASVSGNDTVDINHTITFTLGQGDTAISPSIINNSTPIVSGTFGDTYTGLDELKFWNRSLLDHELRGQYLLDKLYNNLPNVQGIGFGAVQSDAWYMNIPANEKQISNPTLLRGGLNAVADGSVATPTTFLKYTLTNNSATGVLTPFLINMASNQVANGTVPFKLIHSMAAGGNTEAIGFSANVSNAGTGARTSFDSVSGDLRFTTNLNDGVRWGTNKAKIYWDGTNLIIDPKVTGTGIVSLNGGSLSTTGDIAAATFHVGATAGVDITSGTIKGMVVTKGIVTAGTSVTPVADGTYTVGARLTPVTGVDGTITVSGGIITAIQPAT